MSNPGGTPSKNEIKKAREEIHDLIFDIDRPKKLKGDDKTPVSLSDPNKKYDWKDESLSFHERVRLVLEDIAVRLGCPNSLGEVNISIEHDCTPIYTISGSSQVMRGLNRMNLRFRIYTKTPIKLGHSVQYNPTHPTGPIVSDCELACALYDNDNDTLNELHATLVTQIP